MNELEVIEKIIELHAKIDKISKKITQISENGDLTIKSINERLSNLERK